MSNRINAIRFKIEKNRVPEKLFGIQRKKIKDNQTNVFWAVVKHFLHFNCYYYRHGYSPYCGTLLWNRFFSRLSKTGNCRFFPYQHKHVRMNNERFLNIENNFNDNPKGFNEWMNIRSNKKYSMKWKKLTEFFYLLRMIHDSIVCCLW